MTQLNDGSASIIDLGEGVKRFGSGVTESRWMIHRDDQGKVVCITEEITCSFGARWNATQGVITSMVSGQSSKSVYKDNRTAFCLRQYMYDGQLVRADWYNAQTGHTVEALSVDQIRPIHAIPPDRRDEFQAMMLTIK